MAAWAQAWSYSSKRRPGWTTIGGSRRWSFGTKDPLTGDVRQDVGMRRHGLVFPARAVVLGLDLCLRRDAVHGVDGVVGPRTWQQVLKGSQQSIRGSGPEPPQLAPSGGEDIIVLPRDVIRVGLASGRLVPLTNPT